MNTETTVPSVQALIQKAYDSLKASDVAAAQEALNSALKIDFDHEEVLYALTCLNWWLDQIQRLPEFHNPYDQGGFILDQWKAYYTFLDRPGIGDKYDRCQYALRRFIYSTALQSFENVLGDGVNQFDPGLLLQVGRCYKGVGNYELAIKYLEQAARFKREDSETLSELADVNALLDETKIAKVLFREAFFIEPQGIALRSMESEMIKRLRDRVRDEFSYQGAELAEWLPIYGCLWGVFSVKRELKVTELGRLRQSISAMENELQGGHDDKAVLKPRLINRYFWLIDHYENNRDDPTLIEDAMLKIKRIDPVIYERYRN
jgi:tetratricopeptide (TPR) repeat protein